MWRLDQNPLPPSSKRQAETDEKNVKCYNMINFPHIISAYIITAGGKYSENWSEV